MSVVIKTKKTPKVKQRSLSHVLHQNFAECKQVGARTLKISSTTAALKAQGSTDDWYKAVVDRACEVAKSQGNHVAKAELERDMMNRPVAVIELSSAIPGFALGFKADLLEDLRDAEYHKGAFDIQALTVSGDENSGTIEIEWKPAGRMLHDDAKVRLRDAIKSLFHSTYDKRATAFGSRGKDFMTVTYKDVPR